MKQTINNNFSRQFLGLGIVILTVIFAFGCGQSNTPANGNTAANGNSNSNKSASTSANTSTASTTSETSKLEQKAQSIVGKWETTTALDDKITFDFSQPKKEGETYVGTYKFIVNDDTSEPPAKYVVSADKMIKFLNEEGKEYPLIKVSISDDGKTLMYFDQKGGQSKLTKATDSVSKDGKSEEKGDCTVKADNAEFFDSATEKTTKLKKGTSIQYVQFGNQGIAIVKAQIDGKWVKGEIQNDLLDCPDDGKGETEKK